MCLIHSIQHHILLTYGHCLQQEEVERRLKEEFEEELLERQMRELELERQKEQERLDEEVALKKVLKAQVYELKDRERQVRIIQTGDKIKDRNLRILKRNS